MVPQTADENLLNWVFWSLVLAIMVPYTLLIAWIDGAKYRVPNWSTMSLTFVGLMVNFALFGWWNTDQGLGLGVGLLGWFVGMLPLFLVFFIGGMGAGDVKLIGAWGAWLGPQLVLTVYIVGLLVGGVMGILMPVLSGRWKASMANYALLAEKVRSGRLADHTFASTDMLVARSGVARLPYGVPLTIGLFMVLNAHLFGPSWSRVWYTGFWESLGAGIGT